MVYWECSGRLVGSGLPGLAPAQPCPFLPSLGSQRPRHCFRGVGVFISSELRYIASMSLCLQVGEPMVVHNTQLWHGHSICKSLKELCHRQELSCPGGPGMTLGAASAPNRVRPKAAHLRGCTEPGCWVASSMRPLTSSSAPSASSSEDKSSASETSASPSMNTAARLHSQSEPMSQAKHMSTL